eukprot:jgi/Tetstr1/430389/TSEL_020199.t1
MDTPMSVSMCREVHERVAIEVDSDYMASTSQLAAAVHPDSSSTSDVASQVRCGDLPPPGDQDHREDSECDTSGRARPVRAV